METPALPSQDLIDEFVGVCHGDLARATELLAEYPALARGDVRAQWGESGIEAAAQMGLVDLVEQLLAAGAPLEFCTLVMLGPADEVRAALAADPALAHATGAHGIPVLYFAAIRGHLALAEALRAAGADINAGAGMNTALHGAAMFDQAAMAEWLLAQGARTDAPDFDGKTALERAEAGGATEVARVLRG